MQSKSWCEMFVLKLSSTYTDDLYKTKQQVMEFISNYEYIRIKEILKQRSKQRGILCNKPNIFQTSFLSTQLKKLFLVLIQSFQPIMKNGRNSSNAINITLNVSLLKNLFLLIFFNWAILGDHTFTLHFLGHICCALSFFEDDYLFRD